MVNANLYADTVEKKKDDAKELVAILNKIPEEKKGEVIGNMAIAFCGTSGVQMGWLASQADMLSEDWKFAE